MCILGDESVDAYYRMNSSSVKRIQLDISNKKYFTKFVLEISWRVPGFLWEGKSSSVQISSISIASERVNCKLWHLKNYLYSTMRGLTMFYSKEWSCPFELLYVVRYLFFALFTDAEQCKWYLIIWRQFLVCLHDQFLINSLIQCRWCSSSM